MNPWKRITIVRPLRWSLKGLMLKVDVKVTNLAVFLVSFNDNLSFKEW